MNDQQFEQLLFEEETTALDFKKAQYEFVKATEEQKSELLKDILGFANAWRRSDAFILIGVQEVRGDRSTVVGISATDHLDDHALQQFVNNLTNRPIPFHYEAFGFEGKQVGIIRIDHNARKPFFLNKDYGKLKKGAVYIRRGSSTDPTKPAGPDEIAQMGSGDAWSSKTASLLVEFADAKREEALGKRIDWTAEKCRMPKSATIPRLKDRPHSINLPGGHSFQIPAPSSLGIHDRINADYYVELANHIWFTRLCKEVRLVVTNTGDVPATDVRLELTIQIGTGLMIFDWSDVPEAPERRENFASAAMKSMKIRPAFRHAGYVEIESNQHQVKVEIDCGNLQPGRKVWSDCFFLGIGETGEAALRGTLYAANLTKPQEFTLTVNATIHETTMSVEELVSKAPDKSRAGDDVDS